MRFLNNDELLLVEGGFNITGSMLTSIVRGISTVLEAGRSFGSSIRRIYTGNLCGF